MASRLRYEDRWHRYALDGKYVPSVTGITGVLNKPGLPPAAAKETALWALHNRDQIDALGEDTWLKTCSAAYRDVWGAKRDRGTGLHAHAEQLLRTGYTDAPTDQLPLVYSAADFLDRWDVQPIFTEAPVYHSDHLYAGRLDLVAELADGDIWLLDFKTGSGVYPEMVLQSAGYRFASHLVGPTGDIPMPAIDHAGIVHIRPGTEDVADWDLHPVAADRDVFGTFLALQAAYEYTQRNTHGLVFAPLPH